MAEVLDPKNSQLDVVLAQYAAKGYAIWDNCLPESVCERYRNILDGMYQASAFSEAHIGRGEQRVQELSRRSDRICWLDDELIQVSFSELQQLLTEIQTHVNRTFYLGLRHIELHAAIYEPGCHYERHLDQHQYSDVRVITTVFYLNPEWTFHDGGLLKLYIDECDALDILPIMGRLVLFDSARFEHEVTPSSHKDRFSITGWFRRDGFMD